MDQVYYLTLLAFGIDPKTDLRLQMDIFSARKHNLDDGTK